MLNCSVNQILKLWSELEDCKNKTNGYGGDVAEIYAYTLREDKPSHNRLRQNSEHMGTESEIYGEDIRQENLDVGKSLVMLCQKFSKDRECNVEINSIDVFSEELQDFSFDHRTHVKVTPK